MGPSFITVTGPTHFFFLPIFSLSPPFASLLLSPLLSGISWPLHRRRQTKKYPTKQKQTKMQETILSVLSDKKKSEEGKEEERREMGEGGCTSFFFIINSTQIFMMC